jgi:hypothetical protein
LSDPALKAAAVLEMNVVVNSAVPRHNFLSYSNSLTDNLCELPVLAVLNSFRRRRLRTVESLNQNRVTDMLVFVSQQFAFIINCCYGRDASQTNGVSSSVQIRTMSEFRRICHSRLPQVEAKESFQRR